MGIQRTFGEKLADYGERSRQNQYYADVAASIQAVTEEVLIRMAKHAYEQTGYTRLCMGCRPRDHPRRRDGTTSNRGEGVRGPLLSPHRTFRRGDRRPIVLNTSLNLKGEPIVNTPQNAFNTFIKSEMDLLVLDHHLVDKA